MQLLSDRYEKSPKGIGTIATAKGILKDVIFASSPCTIVIDALDEITTNNRNRQILLSSLRDILQDIPLGLKMLCSTRDIDGISDIFIEQAANKNTLIPININISPGMIRHDVEKVIHHEMTKNNLRQKLERTSNAEVVAEKLLEGSHGMFLLPVMMIKDLASKPTLPAIWKFLEELPTDLHKYYSSILDKIDSTKLGVSDKSGKGYGKTILTLLAWNKEALSYDQLEDSLTFGGKPDLLDLRSDIKSAFGCLVSLENDMVKLSHPSVRRYITTSPEFHTNKWSHNLVTSDPSGYIAELCLDYLLSDEYDLALYPPPTRFASYLTCGLPRDRPFLKYATIHWLHYCCEAKSRITLLSRIASLLCSSQRLLYWYYSVTIVLKRIAVFGVWSEDVKYASVWGDEVIYATDGFRDMCRELQNVLLDLQAHQGINKLSDDQLKITYEIEGALRNVLGFEALWGRVVLSWPQELYNLQSLLQDPYYSKENSQQKVLISRHFASTVAHHGPMLEQRYLADNVDRFALTATNIYMWPSLMPSTSSGLRYSHALDVTKGSKISLQSEAISSTMHVRDLRVGLEYASVGSFLTTFVISKDRKYLAFVWKRFTGNEIKTYLFRLEQRDEQEFLKPVPWTFGDPSDPCRADSTSSSTFLKSKQAAAITSNPSRLWTAGGLYDIESSTGNHQVPHSLLRNHEYSELTFAEYGGAIAGLRGTQLELYTLTPTRCCIQATAMNAQHILSVSPEGKFCLFIADRVIDGPARSPNEEVKLLCLDDRKLTLWQYSTVFDVEGEQRASTEFPKLGYFYNGGGLHAFSDDEAVLVLCVPTQPAWSLLAFDLKAKDITGSMRKLPHANLLRGAQLTSFCFPKTQDGQLCLLDSLGKMRILQMSGSSKNAVATVLENKRSILISGVIFQDGEYKVYSALVSGNSPAVSSRKHSRSSQVWSHKVFLTNIESLESTESTSISLDWIEQAKTIKSDTLVVDSDPVIQATTKGLMTKFDNMQKLFQNAQNTISELTSHEYDPEVVSSPEQPVSRTTTSITFEPSINRTFIHSFIYRPLPNVGELPKWSQTMAMEVYDRRDHNSRHLKVFRGPHVEVAAEGYLASALHKDVLAFSFSPAHACQTNATILCVWNLHCAESEQGESEQCYDYVERKLSEPNVSNLAFFPDARYLYGTSQGLGVFQFDVEKGVTLRRMHLSSLGYSHMCLTPRVDGLDVVGQTQSGVYQVRLPTEVGAKLKVRQIFAGPHIQQRYDKITLLRGSGQSGMLAVVFTLRNWIRKDGCAGGNTLEPIIMVSSEGGVGDWEETDVIPYDV
ncbi:hypothetical protein BKA63DRAFT_584033 [Paraphoma chrysanthemicola]|nr:hypothetical protein BKA63DRAFT_584033 [Paraphoma chrysanthemicola]